MGKPEGPNAQAPAKRDHGRHREHDVDRAEQHPIDCCHFITPMGIELSRGHDLPVGVGWSAATVHSGTFSRIPR